MFGKNIPSAIGVLCGSDIERGQTFSLDKIISNQDNANQAKSGNKCGHIRTQLKQYASRITKKPRPILIQKLIQNIPKRYKDRTKWLRAISNRRSEREEAIVIVGQAIASYVDLESLEVKYPDNNHIFQHVSIKYLAARTGLGTRRIMRVIEEFVIAGYIAITRQNIKHEDGSIRARTSIRTVSFKFFTHLGVTYKALKKQRDKRLLDKALKASEKRSIEIANEQLKNYKPSINHKTNQIAGAKNFTELIAALKFLTK
jgi:hypothetical protein